VIKIVGTEVGLHHLVSDLKLGDLVRVRYRDRGAYEMGYNESPVTGFITKLATVTEDNPAGLLHMWCIETGSIHILSPKLDLIELISESR